MGLLGVRVLVSKKIIAEPQNLWRLLQSLIRCPVLPAILKLCILCQSFWLFCNFQWLYYVRVIPKDPGDLFKASLYQCHIWKCNARPTFLLPFDWTNITLIYILTPYTVLIWQTSNDKEKQNLIFFFDYLDQMIIYLTSRNTFKYSKPMKINSFMHWEI